MQILSQRDQRWINTKLGFGNGTIGDFGCTITCLAMLLGTTPDVVNERLKAVNGFSDGKTLGKGNLLVWAKIEEAFPGIKQRRVWSYNNDDVKANVGRVLVEVPAKPIGGTGSHWVIYIGNQRLYDPWTGKERPTSDFPNATGYCVISGAWQQAQPQPLNTQDILDALRDERDRNWNLYQAQLAISNQLQAKIEKAKQDLG